MNVTSSGQNKLKINSLDSQDVRCKNIINNDTIISEKIVIDSTDISSFIIRQNNVGNTVFNVDTQEGKITINGDLLVNGNSQSITTEHTDYKNPYLGLNIENKGDSIDMGFYSKYIENGSDRYSAFFRKATDKEYYLVNGLQNEPNLIFENVTGSQYANLNLKNLYAYESVDVDGPIGCYSVNTNNLNVNGDITLSQNIYIQEHKITPSIANHLKTINQNLNTVSNVTFNQINANLQGNILTANQPNITTLNNLTNIGSINNTTVINSTLSVNNQSRNGLICNFLSGNDNFFGEVGIGRSTKEMVLAVCNNVNQYFNGCSTGDCVIRVENPKKLYIGDHDTPSMIVHSSGTIELPNAPLLVSNNGKNGVAGQFLSGNNNNWLEVGFGRSTKEMLIGISSGNSLFFPQVQTGDTLIRLESTDKRLIIGNLSAVGLIMHPNGSIEMPNTSQISPSQAPHEYCYLTRDVFEQYEIKSGNFVYLPLRVGISQQNGGFVRTLSNFTNTNNQNFGNIKADIKLPIQGIWKVDFSISLSKSPSFTTGFGRFLFYIRDDTWLQTAHGNLEISVPNTDNYTVSGSTNFIINGYQNGITSNTLFTPYISTIAGSPCGCWVRYVDITFLRIG